MEVGGASPAWREPGAGDARPQAAAPHSKARPRLHGRDSEQERIALVVRGAHAGRSGALVLHGELGIGKSSLLAHARDQATDMRVLRCQGDPAESEVSFAALHQLLRPLLPFLPVLPPPLAARLAGAMGLARAIADRDRFMVRTAALTLLARASHDRPVLCLVDDAQWLDEASADTLSFVGRRLSSQGVVLLVAVRDGEGRPFEAAGVPELWLDRVSPGAAADLLGELSGGQLAPEVAEVLMEHAAGLPLALVDAARCLTKEQLRGRAPLQEPLPVSRRLRRAFVQHVRRLSGPTQRLLLLAAAAGVERQIVVAGAGAELGIDTTLLESAEAAGLLLIGDGMVRFRSQLVQRAVYHDATFFERRAAHLALATVLGREGDGERRVSHLAASAIVRDEVVAGELERAAERASGRSELPSTADALQRAADLTPTAYERSRRLAAAAKASWLAGRPGRAVELLSRAERLDGEPLLSADIAELQGVMGLRAYQLEAARDSLVAGARAVSTSHPGRAVQLLVQAAEVALAGSDRAAAASLASQAEALSHDGALEGAALLRGVERVLGGSLGEGSGVAEQAIAMARKASRRRSQLLGLAAALSAGHDLPAQTLTSALDLSIAEVSAHRAVGGLGALPNALAGLAWLELWADRHRSCLANASEGLARARSLGQPWAACGCAMTLAMIAAARGQEDECRTFADLLLHPPGAQSTAMHAGAATWALALADLGAGRFAEALRRLGDMVPGSRPAHPWQVLWSRPDAVEAAVRGGRMVEARAALHLLETAAARGWPPQAQALLARSRALLVTGDEAERHYLTALALHSAADRPFQQARTRLLWGEHLRRSRRRLDAREQLRSALETFEQLDARPWAARARAELRATGETARRSRLAADTELTPQEVRIAQLVAEGCSNREVAEQLFLSPRTVGYHLSRVFQKLDVSSRTMLARVLPEDAAGDPDRASPARR